MFVRLRPGRRVDFVNDGARGWVVCWSVGSEAEYRVGAPQCEDTRERWRVCTERKCGGVRGGKKERSGDVGNVPLRRRRFDTCRVE